MRRAGAAVGLLALLACAGCASAPARSDLAALLTLDTQQGWRALGAGRTDEADAIFGRAGADAVALFGAASIAYERGRGDAAFAGYMGVAERAAAGGADAWSRLLAGAAVLRAARVLDETQDRAAGEERMLRLPREHLPWSARADMALTDLAILAGRGDAEGVRRAASQAGCPEAAAHLGRVGTSRRVEASLDEAPRLDGPAPALLVGGCVVSIPAADMRPGVQAVRLPWTATAGVHDLVVEMGEEARLRIDDGPWLAHGDPTRYGPRRSRFVVDLAAGTHAVELRVATGGAGTSAVVWLARHAPDDDEAASAAADTERLPPEAALPLSYAQAIELDRRGDVDAALGLVGSPAWKRFAPGLAFAARLWARDPTRPTGFGRDAALAASQAAVALDPKAARVWQDIADRALADDHPKEAAEAAERGLRAEPGYFRVALTLVDALERQGFDAEADAVIGASLAATGERARPCALFAVAARRARTRQAVASAQALERRLAACDAEDDVAVDGPARLGQAAAVEAALRRRLALDPTNDDLRRRLADTLLAAGRPAEAQRRLDEALGRAPRDGALLLAWVHAALAAGARVEALAKVRAAVTLAPGSADVRAAARVLGVPLPTDEFRIDGADVIAAFEAEKRSYTGPSVHVLDRAVAYVLDDGGELMLTHSIVKVLSKDGADRWGEVAIPAGADLLTLRARKANGTVREPEVVMGKGTVSMPNLEVGDFVEWETIEGRAGHNLPEARAGDPAPFAVSRFYFASADSPFDRSEYLVVTPPGRPVTVERGPGAPEDVLGRTRDGRPVHTFTVRHSPQLFAERLGPRGTAWVPWVRVWSGADVSAWARLVGEAFTEATRDAPPVREAVARLRARSPKPTPADLVRFVQAEVEPGGQGFADPASFGLVRREGNRAAVLVAMARHLGFATELNLARPRSVAAPEVRSSPADFDDWSEVLVRLADPAHPQAPALWIDPRLRRAPPGYLPPALDGAPTIAVPSGQRRWAVSAGPAEERRVRAHLRLGRDGTASGEVVEELSGFAALEWSEVGERVGHDQERMRKETEGTWVARHFPGATLVSMHLDAHAGDGRTRVRYTIRGARLGAATRRAAGDGGGGVEMRIAPRFFASQPGRRYAAEPLRRTELIAGAEVTGDVEVTIELPAGARLVTSGAEDTVVERPASARFEESRRFDASGATPRVVVRRRARLPLVRVMPADYPAVAAALRRVDAAEEADIVVMWPEVD